MFRFFSAQQGALLQLALLAAAVGGCSQPAGTFNYTTLPDPTRSAYRIQPGDLLQVRVMRNENSSGSFTVRPDGYISFPLGGELAVTGLTPGQVKRLLVRRLKKYLEDPEEMVSVSLEQVRGNGYAVLGEVNRAGMFESPRYVTVLEALANAGGLTAYAQPDAIYVLRRAGPQQLRIPISYRQTVKDPSANRNFFLLPGDIVVVP